MTTLPVLVVSKATIQKAIAKIDSCQNCFEYSEYLFSDVLKSLGASEAEYLLPIKLYCPFCAAEIREDTLVSIGE